MTVYAYDTYKSNAELILACRELGYLSDDMAILDPTYGEGTFWNEWRPRHLVARDIEPKASGVKASNVKQLDFLMLKDTVPKGSFDAVVFDPPYKLNGTPDPGLDARYGIDKPVPWYRRMEHIEGGVEQCCWVSSKWVLVKCQDQVSSGKVRWQTWEIAGRAYSCDFELFDMLHYVRAGGGRPQPEGRRQIHSRRNGSTMMVFRRIP